MAAVGQPSFSPLKPHLSYADQLDLLRARNLTIGDERAALDTLQRLGYYRLVGYWFPLRRPDPANAMARLDEFEDGATFELAVDLYNFDRTLRLLVLDAIERIEVAIRVDVAYLLGKRHRLAHECASLLDSRFTSPRENGRPSGHSDWMRRYQDGVRKKTKDEFVAHHLSKYGGKMPIWVATETWDFGLLSKFFAGMKYGDRNKIAQRYELDGQTLESWLRALNFVRNAAAHHARLWNRNNPDGPRLPTMQRHHHLHHLRGDDFARRRVYGSLCVTRYLLKCVDSQSQWIQRLKSLADTFPISDLVSLRNGGFPPAWQDLALWAAV
ncbi:Abi family protein [Pararobbsia silviterrae]|uniref:Abi family protein n=1 Tax=Pararobbsia silviterrae TaxID=1792498 RepID=A0A494X7A3_9BURK|nr:Abi family protein [Pararobbsia silviterrae]RKP46172.1 Abi family protein [Pararobbsia silviterrae]